jgi:ADP-heptose:LPS heptosyltransferase
VNSLTKHLIARGVTPVLLGKEELAPDYSATRAVGIKTKGCLDLRNQTTLPEAAVIMSKARFILGMDGGLLHLASCTDRPVAFIFTSVHPDFRIPYRRAGLHTTVITPPKELHCRFCNTGEPGKKSMTYVLGHDFKHCLYKDDLCTKIIDAKTLIPVVDELLEETRGN